jgi:DNA-binding CsgD family transcriptional regulator
LKFLRKKLSVSIKLFPERIISIVLLTTGILQAIFLIIYKDSIFVALIFILVFFIGIGFLPVYMNYSGVLKIFIQDRIVPASLDGFCKKYEISPREKEIITEICNGLSNQQIADKLFISLQTVKDHTHRIYGKVDVASRVQLIKLIGNIPVT